MFENLLSRQAKSRRRSCLAQSSDLKRMMALDLRCNEYAFNYAWAERRREEKNLGSLEFRREM